jgi:Protein of unknown function (DUF3592)
MWGTGLITLIEFCVRASILAFKRLRSSHWIAKEANVTSAEWRKPFACGLAQIQYHYSVGGNKYTGSHSEPFWTMGQGDGSVRSLPPGTAVQIRYGPQDPAKSIFVDRWWRNL